MEKDKYNPDDGGFGGGPGDLTLTPDDAGFDDVVDRFNKQGAEDRDPSALTDEDDSDSPKIKRHAVSAHQVAPKAPPTDNNAPVGSETNPIHTTKTGGL